ncbi:hypothetical protein [Streptomyces afghaniensis 772] [Streptomyces afghaniensis]
MGTEWWEAPGRVTTPAPGTGCVVTGIDGAPIGETGRGLVAAADDETHGLLMSMMMRSRG